MSLDAAASHVLGVSLRKLSIGVMQKWRMSPRIAASMNPTAAGEKVRSDDDLRLRVLSAFSNELCATIATSPAESRDEADARALLARYKGSMNIPPATGAGPSDVGSRLVQGSVRYALEPRSGEERSSFAMPGPWQQRRTGAVARSGRCRRCLRTKLLKVPPRRWSAAESGADREREDRRSRESDSRSSRRWCASRTIRAT